MVDEQYKTSYAPAEGLDNNIVNLQNQTFQEDELFIKVLNSLNVLVVILNEHRQIVYANKKYLHIINIEVVETIIGQRLGESLNCIHSNDNRGLCGTSEACKNCSALNIFLKSVELKEEVEGESSIVISEDGFQKTLNLFEKVIPTKINSDYFYIMSFIDATDSVRRRSMERMFFHDIINTAGALRGILMLLKDQVPINFHNEVEEVESMFEGLLEEIQSQKQLLAAENDDLLPELAEFNSLEVLKSIKKLYEIYGKSSNKTIKIDEKSINISLKSDVILLKRIISNMLKNALEATDTNGSISIGCCKVEESYIQYWVKNDKYMAEEIQIGIFKRSFSTKGVGRGLGTYSMKLLGEKYLNGIVGFETSKEEGTKFFIKIPELIYKVGGVRMRILIAEDDLASRIFMKKFLSVYGECDVVVDGIEAIDAYLNSLNEESRYDLICLDIMMPRLDGIKALKSIREIENHKGIEGDKKVKIIMTTALNDKATVFNSYDSGCEAYAWKPIETDKFIEVMKRLGLIE